MPDPALFPAIRARMGDWWYYTATMTFAEIAERVKRVDEIYEASSLKTWIQRQVDDERREQIATYLREQDQHFFNAIVLGIFDGAPDWFPVAVSKGHVQTNVELGERAATAFGLIKLSGTEQIFAIDGQHRVEGIKAALEHEDSAELAKEEQTVILVAHKTDSDGHQRTRRLFTTLNRYAVRVSQGELIALSEDDTYAIVARRLVDEYPGLGSDFVPLYKTANLPQNDKQSLTSLISLYTIVKVLAVPTGRRSPRHLIHGPPNKADEESLFAMQLEFWDAVKAHFQELSAVCRSKPEAGVAGHYRHAEGGHFLLRPFCLVAFAKVVRILQDCGFTIGRAVKVLAKAEMEISAEPWRHLVWNPSKGAMINKNEALVKNLLLHQIGQPLHPARYKLREEYEAALGEAESSYKI